jgi:putative membrane-bound dehydrogenase-like protein
MPRLRFRALLISSCLLVTIGTTSAQVPEPQVPDGFTLQKVAGYPLLHRPIFAGFDEDGILYVGESNGENLNRDQMLAKKPHWITRLEDTDGDGVFDKSTRFVDNITLPQGCLWYRGSVYAACPPSIWKFTDTDGDGKADEREEILTGFGFNGNACDTHGPFLSPTGRLYIVQGRHGHEFKDKDGNVYSKGKAGRIYSCRIDGSDVRVHAGGGFDNPVEVDFTEEGECIGTVNILYRDRGDCLMHWVEGGVYPREDQANCVAEFKWTGGLLGPIHNLGHVACSGIMRYRGVHFGDGFKDRWFFTEFNTHKVRYAELKRAGSTFTADVHEFLTCTDGDFHPTDVLEDADGSLLVLNTGGWFRNGCPTSVVAKPEIYGGVYRVRKTDGVKVDDPRGDDLALVEATAEGLASFLNDARPAVREQALDRLARESAAKNIENQVPYILTELALNETLDETIRRNVIWALARNAQGDPSTAEPSNLVQGAVSTLPDILEQLPADAPASVQQALIHSIGFANEPMPPDRLEWRLWNPDPDIAIAAQTAIGRLWQEYPNRREEDDFRVLLTLWQDVSRRRLTLQLLGAYENRSLSGEDGKAPPIDRYFQHSAIVALTQGGHREILTAALRHAYAPTSTLCLIALGQMEDTPLTQEMVVPLLARHDEALQKAALEVIARRPGWAAMTLSILKDWIREPDVTFDRRNALQFFLMAQLSDPSVQEFVRETIQDREIARKVRVLLWEVLQRSTIATWPETWKPLISDALVSADEQTMLAAVRIVTQRSLPGHDAALRAIAMEAKHSLQTRCEAMAAMGHQSQPFDDNLIYDLMQMMKSDTLSLDVRAGICRALAYGPLSDKQLRWLSSELEGVDPLVLSILVKAFARSTDPAVGQALVAALAKSEAATSVSPDELAGVLRKYPDSVRDAAGPLFARLGVDPAAQAKRLAELSPLLADGDPKLGRNVFFGRKAACSSCHAVGSEGGRIGPHLTTIGASRSPRDLLEAIVYPSASFVNGYRPYVVATTDGRVLEGVISAETTDTITLRTKDLQELRVRRDQIDELRESSTSIMPKGLDTQLTPDELRDLLAYLQSRK